jgi:NAD(P)-dependent dehydrogenase (short-subunit alcohol dehydrogenase family)
MDLSGKVVFITGAASGIGASTARQLADLGATVVVADVDSTSGANVAKELGDRGRFVKLDVTKRDEWDRAVGEVVSEFGGIDILHLNAGVLTRPPDAPDPHDYVLPWLDEKGLRKVMSINVDGVVFGTLAAVDTLASRPGSQIVITSSPAGMGGWAADPYYAMSKAAVNSWVQAMGQVLGSKSIRVNGVMPGAPIDTSMLRPQWKGHPDLAGVNPVDPAVMGKAIVELMQRDDGTGVVYIITPDAALVHAVPRP